MELSFILGVAAALCHSVAYCDYNSQVIRGKTKPNGATWAIWSSLALLSATSYLIMTGDLAKSILSLVNILLCIGTFVLALFLKRFEKPDPLDILALGIGLLATLAWWRYKSAMYANLILQAAIIIGFIPTYRLVWREPAAERPRPWWIWVTAYVVLVATVILRWRGHWQDLVYPLNSALLHCLVPGIAFLAGKIYTK